MKTICVYFGEDRQERRWIKGTLKENPDGLFSGQFVDCPNGQIRELFIPHLNHHLFAVLDDGRRYSIVELRDDGRFRAAPDFEKRLAGKPPNARFVLSPKFVGR